MNGFLYMLGKKYLFERYRPVTTAIDIKNINVT